MAADLRSQSRTIGKFPNAIKPNQHLIIPDIPDISGFKTSEKSASQSQAQTDASAGQSDKPQGTRAEPTPENRRKKSLSNRGSSKSDPAGRDHN
jgi:hypothetical protein